MQPEALNVLPGLVTKFGEYFAFVTRHLLTSQYSSSGVIESKSDLYLDFRF